jgi:hypothetical protein
MKYGRCERTCAPDAWNNSEEEEAYPFCEQQSRKYSVYPDLRTNSDSETLDELELRGFCNGVWHAAPSLTDGSDASRGNHVPTIRIRFESTSRFTEQCFGYFDIRAPAFVPFFLIHGIEVFPVGEARPTSIRNDDIQTSQLFNSLLNSSFRFSGGCHICFDDYSIDPQLLTCLLDFLRGFDAVKVVDRYVCAFLCERFAEEPAEATVG